MAQARYIEESVGAREGSRSGAARASAHEPARDSTGAVPGARRCEHAGGARRDGLHHQRGAGAAARLRAVSSRRSCRRSSTASRASVTNWQARDRRAPRSRHPCARAAACDPDAAPHRRVRRDRACSRSREAGGSLPGSAPPDASPRAPGASTPGTPAAADARKITATLYFVSEDGLALVGVQREVPFGETVLDQAKQIVIAQLAAAR